MFNKLFYLLLAVIVMLPFTYSSGNLENYLDDVYVYIGSNGSDAKMLKAEDYTGEVSGKSGVLKSNVDLNRLLKDFNAELMFTEEVLGVKNYYFSCNLPFSVSLYGKKINLHIAVGEKTVVGTPIIFGGY